MKIFTTKEAAEKLGLDPSHVRRLLIASQQTADPIGVKKGHDWLLTPADVRRLARRRGAQAPDQKSRRPKTC